MLRLGTPAALRGRAALALALALTGAMVCRFSLALATVCFALAAVTVSLGCDEAPGRGGLELKAQPLAAWEWAWLAALTALGLGLFLWRLGDLPPGASWPEGLVARYADELGKSPYRLHITDSHVAWPSLVFYLGLLGSKVMGWTPFGLRLAGALLGALSAPLFYLVARRLASPAAAAPMAVLYVANLLHLALGRQLFPGTLTNFFLLGGVGLLLEGMRTRKAWLMGLAGVAAGVTLHAFFPGRTVGAFLLLWLAFLAFRRHPLFPGWPLVAAFLAGYCVVAAPIVWYATVGNPQAYWQHLAEVDPNRGRGLLSYVKTLLGVAPDYWAVFFNRADGDRLVTDGLQGLPIMAADPLTRSLFAVGLFAALLAPLRPINALVLGLFAIGIAPGVMGGHFPHPVTRRIFMVLPAVYLAAALALENVRGRLLEGGAKALVWGVTAALTLISLGTAWFSWHTLANQLDKVEAKLVYNYPALAAGRDMESSPQARAVCNQTFEARVTNEFLLPHITPHTRYVRFQEVMQADPSSDLLAYIEPFQEPGLSVLKALYPGGQAKVWSQPAGQPPVTGFSSDPARPELYLVRFLIPATEAKAARSFVCRQAPSGRVDAFHKDFGRAWAGQRVELKASWFVDDKEAASVFTMGWPGWTLRIDGNPVAWGRPSPLDPGVHLVELAGRVPQNATGPLPLGPAGYADRMLAYDAMTGISLSYLKDGAIAYRREEPLPSYRVLDPTEIPLPFSVQGRGMVRLPSDGACCLRLAGGAQGEVWVGGRLAYAHRLGAGADVEAALDGGRWQRLDVRMKEGERELALEWRAKESLLWAPLPVEAVLRQPSLERRP